MGQRSRREATRNVMARAASEARPPALKETIGFGNSDRRAPLQSAACEKVDRSLM
jgi:hypothetical protein